MANYSYQAVSRTTGGSSTGIVNAEGLEEARTQLKAQGLLVVELNEGKVSAGAKEIKFGAEKVKLKDVAWAARNLADRKSTRLNSSHHAISRMPSSA